MTEQSNSNKLNNPPFLRGSKNIEPPTGKSVSPLAQPRLSHNTMYTNSTKELGGKWDDGRLKIPTGGSPFIPNKNAHFESTSPKNALNNGKPSFLDGKGDSKNPMKGSLFMNDTNTDASSKTSGFHQYNAGSMGESHPKRLPRMSEQP